MALLACDECGKPVSTETQACPHCGAPVRIANIRSGRNPWAELKNPRLWLIVLVVAIVGYLASTADEPQGKVSKASTPQSSIVANEPQERVFKGQTPQSGIAAPQYKIIEQRSFANGGFGRVIVVAPNPSAAELRAFGEKLRQDTRNERNAFVWLYDDERAARIRRALTSENLPKSELRHHDRHYLALYSRNASTGLHEFEYYPQGFDGVSFKVKY